MEGGDFIDVIRFQTVEQEGGMSGWWRARGAFFISLFTYLFYNLQFHKIS